MLKRKLMENSSKTLKHARILSQSNSTTMSSTPSVPESFLKIQSELNTHLKLLKFKPPVTYIYNPVEYAYKGNEAYIRKYCRDTKKVLFVGMNPGPWGMCQTGVPFGEVNAVRDWLGIEEQIDQPPLVCPLRPITGFNCTKSEVSGLRLWGVIKDVSQSPEDFFNDCFVYNYCPLAFMKSEGGNLTPSDIKNDAQQLEAICDESFYRVIELLKPEIIIGIGRYAEKRALLTLKDKELHPKVLFLKHPSPRALNNNNWAETAVNFLKANDLLKFFKKNQQ